MSKMINCKACNKEIAKGVNKCVHCGKDQRNFFGKHKILTFILAVVVLGVVGSAMGGDKDEAKETTATSQTKVKEKKTESKINYDNFLKIKMDSKYEDVVALIGKGTETTSSEVGGIKTVMYTWNGDGMSNMNVTIQNSIVTNKTQITLKSADDKITLEKYNEIKNDMSYSEVKSILGEGQIMSQTKMMDIESIMYVWTNKNASNMNCTFTGDKMELKAQFNLK